MTPDEEPDPAAEPEPDARSIRKAALEALARDHPWRAGPDHLEEIREGWPD